MEVLKKILASLNELHKGQLGGKKRRQPACKHIRKGLEQGHLKKALLNVEWNTCQDCKTTDKESQEKAAEEADEGPSIWLCLKCGHRGCGRNSQEQHALKHYTTPRSDPHCLVLSLDNWSVWCYLCDDEVLYNGSTRLGQLVDYVKKQAHLDTQNTVSKDQENKEFENKKVEKDNRNEEEREKSESLIKGEDLHLNSNTEVSVKGLSNLGNTCFFNAVMQSLSQTPVLRELLKEVKMPGTTFTIEPPEFSIMEPLEIKLDQPGPLTLAMCQFLTEIQETKKGTVTPKELFSQVCKKAVRFKGYQQQDSQELLRYLLDGMRAEEIQRVCGGIFKALSDPDQQNEELEKKIKEYEKKKVIPSFVDRIFGGELTSTIMCEECSTVSGLFPWYNFEKNAKKIKEKEIEDEEEDIDNDSYMKKRDETPGSSKHLQKKAKKLAKKQAKNQRWQQKIQEKVLPLADACDTEQVEENQDSSSESKVEVNSEGSELIQQEESLNSCEEHCSSHKNLNGQENITDVESTGENVGTSEQDGENETGMDVPLEDVASTTESINKFESLSLKDDGHKEHEDVANNLNDLNLDSLTESDEVDIMNGFHASGTKIYKVVNEDPETAFCTLANRDAIKAEESSILHCLYQFTCNERLSENNKLLCDVCTQRQHNGSKTTGKKKHVYTNAKKQMLISLAPPILTLHLKRFQQTGFNLQKVNKHIKFPEVIDLAPFCTTKCKNVAEGNTRVPYSLYGVVEHSGTMRSGHYTAYVKMRPANNHLSDLVLHGKISQTSENESSKGQWFHISDTHVQAVPLSKVLNSQAYLLFYEQLL
uniref:Ubiquitin carboxyl-terminal hydrolase 16 n=1 Tax=Sphenodon punctatus TaxID=8508 RepID=A0A8D0L7L3_SPHPU